MIATLRLEGEIGPRKSFSEKTVRSFIDTKPDCLHLEINSDGGCSKESFRIFSFIRALRIGVSANVTDSCQSGGLLVLMAADRRTASPKATLLFHRAAIDADAFDNDERITAPVLARRANDLQAIDNRMIDLIALRTGADRAWLAREISTEEHMSIADALKHGIIHEITENK